MIIDQLCVDCITGDLLRDRGEVVGGGGGGGGGRGEE